LTFNNDTGANYDIMQWQLANATGGTDSQAGTTSVRTAAIVPWSSSTANNIGSFSMKILNYTTTASFKGGLIEAVSIGATSIGASNLVRNGGFLWRSTASITRLDLTMEAGNWDAMSRVSLYGVY